MWLSRRHGLRTLRLFGKKMRAPRGREGLQAPFHPSLITHGEADKDYIAYVGIGIAVSVFALFLMLVSSIRNRELHGNRVRERLGGTAADRMGRFWQSSRIHPAYAAMYERCPRGRGEGSRTMKMVAAP